MDDSAPTKSRRSRLAPHVFFFPAAALYAAVALPWSVLAMAGLMSAPASLATPFGHAHEMLVGYALAVVAGNQLPPMSRTRATLLFGLGFVARLAFLALEGAAALAYDVAFALALAYHVAPRLFRAAKKLRNQALLTALCAGAVSYDLSLLVEPVAAHAIVTALALALAMLMPFMGGRIIAPAAAGELYRQGRSLAARVQPRIEALLLAVMATAVVGAMLPGYETVVRVACAAAGALAFVRLLRWRLNVMANTMLLKARRSPAAEWIPAGSTALIACATVLRVADGAAGERAADMLIVAAACWSAGFFGALWLFGRCMRGAVGATRRRAARAEAAAIGRRRGARCGRVRRSATRRKRALRREVDATSFRRRGGIRASASDLVPVLRQVEAESVARTRDPFPSRIVSRRRPPGDRAWLEHGAGLAGRRLDSAAQSIGSDDRMKEAAVFYATREGHTRRVAEQVVAGLRKRGVGAAALDVREAGTASDVADRYSAAVLAASVHAGRREREMIEFAKVRRAQLQSMPNAFLSVTLSEAGAERKDATAEEHARFAADVRRMTDRFVGQTGWQPEHVVPVAGALRYTRYNFLVRLIMKRIARQAGGSTDTSRDHDYTDWTALDDFVAAFADEVANRRNAGR